MDKETYIAEIVEAYIPEATKEEKMALTNELWVLFETLYKISTRGDGFDSFTHNMLESSEVANNQNAHDL